MTTTTPSARNIARIARTALGRPAYRSRAKSPGRDWAAWDAVAVAARECGLRGQLGSYVTPAQSLTAMAHAYLSRYIQAYGPVGDLIDVGAHRGSHTPQIVTV